VGATLAWPSAAFALLRSASPFRGPREVATPPVGEYRIVGAGITRQREQGSAHDLGQDHPAGLLTFSHVAGNTSDQLKLNISPTRKPPA
jgi:hypothetical protein